MCFSCFTILSHIRRCYARRVIIQRLPSTIHIEQAKTKEIKWDKHGKKISSKTVLGPTKSGSSEREIVVPDEVIAMLKEWKQIGPTISKTQVGDDDFIFGNNKNPSWTCDGFRTSVNRCLKKSQTDMDRLRLHRLRHTVATMLSNEPDASVFHIMQLLGHTQIKTAQKYIDNATKERAEKNKELLKRLSDRTGLCEG